MGEMCMLWVLVIVVGITVIMILMAFVCIHVAFGVRCEGNPDLKYLTHKDFKNLDAESISFLSDRGQRLRGAVYTYQSVERPLGLVIFSHGMGGGHLSYTTEIYTLSKAGFAVLAYDNTGTMASEGKSIGSFYQAVRDLRSAIAFVREDAELSKYKIVLAGHSWGGYAVCQVLAFEGVYVAGCVAFSPPDKAPDVICKSMRQTIGIPIEWLRPALGIAFVVKDGWNSRYKSSSVLLRTRQVPVLILHGDADKIVPISNSPLSNPATMRKNNITGILYKDRAHNVYQTKESEQYLSKVFNAIAIAQKQYGKEDIPLEERTQLYNIDYELITREDPKVMETVVDFIRRCVEQ